MVKKEKMVVVAQDTISILATDITPLPLRKENMLKSTERQVQDK
jgi:hypothetical protein